MNWMQGLKVAGGVLVILIVVSLAIALPLGLARLIGDGGLFVGFAIDIIVGSFIAGAMPE